MKSVLMSAVAAAAILAGANGVALANQDPILGGWLRPMSPLLLVEECSDKFCIKVNSGDSMGETVGTLKRNTDGSYSGDFKKLGAWRTIKITVRIDGRSLEVSGISEEPESWMRH